MLGLLSPSTNVFASSSRKAVGDCATIYWAGAYDVTRRGGQVYDRAESDEVKGKNEQWNAAAGPRYIHCSVGGEPGSETMYTKSKEVEFANDADADAELCQVVPWDRTIMKCAEEMENTVSEYKVVAVGEDCAAKTFWRFATESGGASSGDCSEVGSCEVQTSAQLYERGEANLERTLCP